MQTDIHTEILTHTQTFLQMHLHMCSVQSHSHVGDFNQTLPPLHRCKAFSNSFCSMFVTSPMQTFVLRLVALSDRSTVCYLLPAIATYIYNLIILLIAFISSLSSLIFYKYFLFSLSLLFSLLYISPLLSSL